MRFRLVDAGFPTYKKIVTGRKWIGRVCKKVDGTYLGIIGKLMVTAPTEREAFDQVVAKHCGFATPKAMDANNAKVRAQNAHRSRAARFIAQELMNGNFKPLDALFDIEAGDKK